MYFVKCRSLRRTEKLDVIDVSRRRRVHIDRNLLSSLNLLARLSLVEWAVPQRGIDDTDAIRSFLLGRNLASDQVSPHSVRFLDNFHSKIAILHLAV